jgi:23S rRNA pseudouridine2605 synthase/23S rRNA pseudouridine2604 synthase
MTRVRLQKYLSSAGVCSRRGGEARIRAGRVQVNGQLVTELGVRISPDSDIVTMDGRRVLADQPPIYIALHKPRGYVTSCRQPGQPIVLDLIDLETRVYPVGRLDRDSTGLLLLTNDGRLHHRLSHPSFDHEKEYIVTLQRPISDGALAKLARGLPMMGARTRPANVVRISGRRFRITLKEGKNRQIRRMVRKVGHRVSALARIRIGNITLGRLAPGNWRHLNAGERKRLLAAVAAAPAKRLPRPHPRHAKKDTDGNL